MHAAADPGYQGTRRDPKLTSRRQLLIRPGAIGDTIVSLPALEHLARTFEAETEVWVSGPCVPLVRFAHRVRSIASTGLDLLELGLPTPVRAELASFRRIVSWYGSARPEFREAVGNLPFTFHPALPANGCGVPAVDFYLTQAGAPTGAVPHICVSAAKRDFIACHPFSGSTKKNWPLERFRALQAPLPVEFCAGPEERLEGALRFQTLDELAVWLASARAYVGNDSGISHLAAAVGTPAVAIFRASDPAVWAPRGRAPVRILTGDPDAADVERELVGCL